MERAIALTLAVRDVGRIEGAKCSRRVREKKLVDLTDQRFAVGVHGGCRGPDK
jgi:hypothetical protein